MEIVILCSEEQKAELSATLSPSAASITWAPSIEAFSRYSSATAFIDLLFDNGGERVAQLARLSSTATIIINSVIETVVSIHTAFVRINGWPTMLTPSVIEGAVADEDRKRGAEAAFAVLGKTVQWVPDVAGLITPRVISTIINEAYFALGDGVSTAGEIDTAMKLGTAYPYGPVEWGNRIGLEKIAALLHTLGASQPRYTPATLLVQEAGDSI